MLSQLAKLSSCLDSGDPWKALLGSYPQLALVDGPGVSGSGLTRVQTRNGIVRMFRTYVKERARFPVAVKVAA